MPSDGTDPKAESCSGVRAVLTSFLLLAALAVAPLAAAAPLATGAAPPAEPVPALPRPGATLLMENDRGSVWDVINPPGVPTAMHRHGADFVGVELVASRLKITTPDGKVEVEDVAHGDMYMLPKGLTHIEEGVAGYPRRTAILIELKDAPSPAYANSTPLPPGFPAEDARQAVDNARVTLWDVSWTPGVPAEPFFQSRDIFLVPIDPGVLVISSQGEPERTVPVAGGQVIFLPGGKARVIGSKSGVVRAAVIELK